MILCKEEEMRNRRELDQVWVEASNSLKIGHPLRWVECLQVELPKVESAQWDQEALVVKEVPQ